MMKGYKTLIIALAGMVVAFMQSQGIMMEPDEVAAIELGLISLAMVGMRHVSTGKAAWRKSDGFVRVNQLILILFVSLAATACAAGAPKGNANLICFESDAATLFSLFSATGSVRGVSGPTDVDGNPLMTVDQLLSANADCWRDSSNDVLLESLRAVQAMSAPVEDGD